MTRHEPLIFCARLKNLEGKQELYARSEMEKNALIIGFKSEDTTHLRLQLKALDFAKVGSFNKYTDVNRSEIVFGSITHLLVNIDKLRHYGTSIGYLSDLRRWRQNVIIILFSEFLKCDDLGHDRKRICDASVRLPFSPERFKNALLAAESNNAAITDHPRNPIARMVRNSPL